MVVIREGKKVGFVFRDEGIWFGDERAQKGLFKSKKTF